MNKIRLDKNIIVKCAVAFVLSVICAGIFYHAIGMKNAVLLVASAFLTIFAVTMLKDRKKSILIFIVSLPILVTARKFFYMDFLVFKLSFEAIYVTILFVASFKDILVTLKNTFKSGNKASVMFMTYTFAFAILALNSTLFSMDILKSIRLNFVSVLIPIMFMLSIVATFREEDIKTIIYTLILQCTFSSLYGFAQISKIMKTGISISNLASHRQQYTFGYHNVNIYAAIAILVIPFIYERILYHKNTKNENIFLYITCFINTMAIVMTFTRGAWLMLMLEIGIILISRKYRKIIIAGVVLLAIGSKPIFSFILRRGMDSSFSILANESLVARIQSILTSFRIMFTYPFGIGEGNYADMYKKFVMSAYQLLPYEFRTKITVASYNMGAAHNLVLHVATELGIITAIIFVILFINRIVYSIKNSSSLRAVAASLTAYIVYTCVTGAELEHKGVITGTLLVWLVFAIVQIKSMKSQEEE